jgi:hypothetical protein
MDRQRHQGGAQVKTFGFIAALALLAGCAVSGGGVGVGVDASVGYDAGYYEPYGYEYGGWGAGYAVAPWRGDHGRRDDHPRDNHPADRGHTPAYRPAPAGRSMPSLPSRPRSR